MPGLDYFEVIAYIQRELPGETPPIVVITADDSEETGQRPNDMGVLEVIIKPASLEAVETVLRQAGLLG
jgi:CheY-like chemotaxis protein